MKNCKHVFVDQHDMRLNPQSVGFIVGIRAPVLAKVKQFSVLWEFIRQTRQHFRHLLEKGTVIARQLHHQLVAHQHTLFQREHDISIGMFLGDNEPAKQAATSPRKWRRILAWKRSKC